MGNREAKDAKDVIHKSSRALVILDMINAFDFDGGEQLLKNSLGAAKRIAKLKARLKKKRIPIIYVNDNFGQWRSDWRKVFEHCSHQDCLGQEIAEIVRPEDDDYFILKPKHSAFYSTTLEVLLEQIGVKELIVTGIAADICVLFSVQDAHVRGYQIHVPQDCVAAETDASRKAALKLMKKVFKIKSSSSSSRGEWVRN